MTSTTALAARILDLSTMAGLDYAWTNVPSSRPSVAPRAGLFDFLKDYAGGLCAFCGEDAATGEACHLVSAGKSRRGYVGGNLAWGCLDCNDLDSQAGAVVRPETVLRPDLIPSASEWPTTRELTARGVAVLEAREAAREAKRLRRGM